jgi:D-3-phosphoglycerate dehydrogenase
VIANADYLTLHLPGGAATRHVIGARELSLMKPSACLVNTGRGEVVDEEALIAALQQKRIRGAALDVFEGNLPRQDNPLLHMENVIVTPHTAAFTTEALQRMAYQAALGIVEVLEHRPVTYPVNKLHDTFEENRGVKNVMAFFRREFGGEMVTGGNG